MNDPSAQPVDVDEQRQWLLDHKTDLGSSASWNTIGKRIGIPGSSLSLFMSGKYNGPMDRFGDAIFRYRQTLAAQAAIKVEAPEIPGFFETETAKKLIFLLQWAHRGRLVTAAMGAGIGKTITAEHYAACNTNVLLLTLSPDITTIYGFLYRLARTLNMGGADGRVMQLAERVRKTLSERENVLLIVDEAQHGDVKIMEMIRTLHDQLGIGVALFGNESVQQRLEGGNRSAAFAQLFSRQSLKLVRSFPLAADIDALLDAWKVEDEAVRKFIHEVGRKPGALRGVTFTLELATMIADSGKSPLALGHVQDAWAQLSARAVAA